MKMKELKKIVDEKMDVQIELVAKLACGESEGKIDIENAKLEVYEEIYKLIITD